MCRRRIGFLLVLLVRHEQEDRRQNACRVYDEECHKPPVLAHARCAPHGPALEHKIDHGKYEEQAQRAVQAIGACDKILVLPENGEVVHHGGRGDGGRWKT